MNFLLVRLLLGRCLTFGCLGHLPMFWTKCFKMAPSHSKWKSRAWLGVYIGVSICHSSAIPLIYNPASAHISPQYHVVYDEYFTMVASNSMFDTEAYLDKLYQTSARWLHCDEFSNDPRLLWQLLGQFFTEDQQRYFCQIPRSLPYNYEGCSTIPLSTCQHFRRKHYLLLTAATGPWLHRLHYVRTTTPTY